LGDSGHLCAGPHCPGDYFPEPAQVFNNFETFGTIRTLRPVFLYYRAASENAAETV
jgi:hypothetical protein